VDGLTGLYTVMPVTIDILTAKTDYSRTVLSDWKLDLGFKMSSIFSDNDMKLSSGPVEDMTIDQELSNHFQYTEEVHAMYASVVGKLGQVEVQAGLRAEHTHSKGESLSLNEVVERNYWNLFPTLFISRKLSTKQSLTFSYSHRIDRPGYQTLNPARSYLDPYSFSRGNPYLQPQYTHAIQLKHGWDSKIFTSVGADFVSDYIFYLIQPVDTESTERTPDNIGTSKSFNVNVSFPINFSKAWSFQGNMMALYTRLDYVYLGNELTVQQFTGRFNGTNSFNLGKSWTAELTGWLNTPQTNTIFVSPWRGQVDVGLQKVYKKNLKIKLSLQDVFKTYVWAGHGKTDGYEQDARITFDTRVLMLNVNYIFGNQQMKAVRQRNTASDDEVQRTN
jgi:outer membrane receptor protein involved in Fe transport